MEWIDLIVLFLVFGFGYWIGYSIGRDSQDG